MGCNCGGKNNEYVVKFADGNRQTYQTLSEAQAAIRAAGQRTGSTIKAQPRKRAA